MKTIELILVVFFLAGCVNKELPNKKTNVVINQKIVDTTLAHENTLKLGEYNLYSRSCGEEHVSGYCKFRENIISIDMGNLKRKKREWLIDFKNMSLDTLEIVYITSAHGSGFTSIENRRVYPMQTVKASLYASKDYNCVHINSTIKYKIFPNYCGRQPEKREDEINISLHYNQID